MTEASRVDLVLDGAQRRALADALCEAFPDREQLAQLTEYRLGLSLDEITSGGNLRATASELVRHAKATGRLVLLLRQACRENPGNPALRRLERRLLPNFSCEQLQKLDELVKEAALTSKQLEQLAQRSAPRDWLFPPPSEHEGPEMAFSRFVDSLSSAPMPAEGEHPLLKFIEQLADVLDGHTAGQFREWLQRDQRAKAPERTGPGERPRPTEVWRRAFETTLPSEWLIRAQVPDYGLDAEVQVFKNRQPTHLRFLARVEPAEVASKSGKSIKHSVPCSHLLYYRDGNTPVMLVVYDAQHQTLFYEWVQHVFERLTRRQWVELHSQETFTLQLTQKLLPGQSAQLEKELRRFYFQSGNPPGTLGSYKVDVSFPATPSGTASTLPFDPEAIERELRHWLSRIEPRQRIILDAHEADAGIGIRWEEGRLFLDHWGPRQELPIGTDVKAGDVTQKLTLVCKLLVSFMAAAASLGEPARAMLSDLITNEEEIKAGSFFYLLPVTARIFAESGHASDALDLAEFLLETGYRDAAVMLATAVPLQEGVSALTSQRFRRLIMAALATETNPKRKAPLHYSLANNLRASGHHRKAITQYLEAARWDERYYSRSYWWAEFAGCLFLSGRRRLALFFYRAARDMGESRFQVGVLIADVLLYLGRFKEAVFEFDAQVAAGQQLSAEFVLKRWLARFLASKFGDTRRRIGEAFRLAKHAYGQPSEIQPALLEEALRLDPLCEYAWFNYAVLKNMRDDEDRGDYWIAAAILTPWDIEARVNGIVILHASEDEERITLFEALLAVAHKWDANALREELVKRFRPKAQENAQEAEQLVQSMMDLARKTETVFEAQAPKPPFVLRMLDVFPEEPPTQ